jgi:hypothetical protein
LRRAACLELRMRSFERSESHGVPVARWLAIVAAGATAALSVLVFWQPHHRHGDAAGEVDGEALFVAISESQPATKKASRVGNAASGSRIVLPQPTWERLSVGERDALARYLDAAGGSWQICVGGATRDGSRVLAAEPALTSKTWAQPLR